MYICRCRMMMNCVDHYIWYIGAYAVSIIMGCKHYNHDVGVNLLIQCELDSLQQSFPCILWHAEAQAVSGPHLDFLFRVPPGDSDFFLFLSSTQQTVLSRMPNPATTSCWADQVSLNKSKAGFLFSEVLLLFISVCFFLLDLVLHARSPRLICWNEAIFKPTHNSYFACKCALNFWAVLSYDYDDARSVWLCSPREHPQKYVSLNCVITGSLSFFFFFLERDLTARPATAASPFSSDWADGSNGSGPLSRFDSPFTPSPLISPFVSPFTSPLAPWQQRNGRWWPLWDLSVVIFRFSS